METAYPTLMKVGPRETKSSLPSIALSFSTYSNGVSKILSKRNLDKSGKLLDKIVAALPIYSQGLLS